jgi:hypothetical protein
MYVRVVVLVVLKNSRVTLCLLEGSYRRLNNSTITREPLCVLPLVPSLLLLLLLPLLALILVYFEQ